MPFLTWSVKLDFSLLLQNYRYNLPPSKVVLDVWALLYAYATFFFFPGIRNLALQVFSYQKHIMKFPSALFNNSQLYAFWRSYAYYSVSCRSLLFWAVLHVSGFGIIHARLWTCNFLFNVQVSGTCLWSGIMLNSLYIDMKWMYVHKKEKKRKKTRNGWLVECYRFNCTTNIMKVRRSTTFRYHFQEVLLVYK